MINKTCSINSFCVIRDIEFAIFSLTVNTARVPLAAATIDEMSNAKERMQICLKLAGHLELFTK